MDLSHVVMTFGDATPKTRSRLLLLAEHHTKVVAMQWVGKQRRSNGAFLIASKPDFNANFLQTRITSGEAAIADTVMETVKKPWHLILTAVNTFIIGHLVTKYICTISPTIGPSMLPALNVTGDYVLISKLHGQGRFVGLGDLVSFNHPVLSDGTVAIKRIVGMPGDFVLRDTPDRGDGVLVQVPPGHCWVAGDNVDLSRDSRLFGALPLGLIRGKVMARVMPFRDFRLYRSGFEDCTDG